MKKKESKLNKVIRVCNKFSAGTGMSLDKLIVAVLMAIMSMIFASYASREWIVFYIIMFTTIIIYRVFIKDE